MLLCKKKMSFEEYLVPVLPNLIYEKDGSEQQGEVLFIAEQFGNFTISFESGMECFDLLVREQEDYHKMHLSRENKKLYLCYPMRRENAQLHMGYFHYELTDEKGELHVLPGQIDIGLPQEYEHSLKVMTVLQDILFGLQLKSGVGRKTGLCIQFT